MELSETQIAPLNALRDHIRKSRRNTVEIGGVTYFATAIIGGWWLSTHEWSFTLYHTNNCDLKGDPERFANDLVYIRLAL